MLFGFPSNFHTLQIPSFALLNHCSALAILITNDVPCHLHATYPTYVQTTALPKNLQHNVHFSP